MNIKDLEQASILINQIKAFDKKILELEKVISKCDNNQKIFVTVNSEKDRKLSIDMDYNNSLKDWSAHGMILPPFSMFHHIQNKESKIDYSFPIDEEMTYIIVNNICILYKERRERLLKELHKLGIKN